MGAQPSQVRENRLQRAVICCSLPTLCCTGSPPCAGRCSAFPLGKEGRRTMEPTPSKPAPAKPGGAAGHCGAGASLATAPRAGEGLVPRVRWSISCSQEKPSARLSPGPALPAASPHSGSLPGWCVTTQIQGLDRAGIRGNGLINQTGGRGGNTNVLTQRCVVYLETHQLTTLSQPV